MAKARTAATTIAAKPVKPAMSAKPEKPTKAAKPAAAATPAAGTSDAGATAATATRRFTFQADGSDKFWEIACAGSAFTVRFGRTGSAGQSQTKSFPTAAAAQARRPG